MRIAQITDSHLVPPDALWKDHVDMAAALSRAVERLNALEPDLVVHTGDVVDMGGGTEYAAAVEILSRLTAPLRLLPGNHDDRDRMRAAFPSQNWDGDVLQFRDDVDGLRLIGLDTVDPGRTAGRYDVDRADWLRAALGSDGPTLIFAHHPPCPMNLPHMDRFVFEGGELIAEALKDRQVMRIACGHVHCAAERHWAGTLVSACPALGVQIPPAGPGSDASNGGIGYNLEPAAIRLHDWDADTGLTVKTVPVEAFPGPFPFEKDPNANFDETPRSS